LQPYVSAIAPTAVPAWEFDETGKLWWIRFLERETKDVEGGTAKQFLTWTRNAWVRQVLRIGPDGDMNSAKLETVAGEYHTLGRVPVTVYRARRSARYPDTGKSILNDIAFVNRQVNQWASLLDSFVHQQNFSHLFYPEGTFAPGQETQLGITNATELPGEARFMPQFVGPPTEHGEFTAKQIAWGIAEIYRLATLDNTAGSPRHDAPESGYSKEMDFQRANQVFVKLAKECEYTETEIVDILARWMGWPPDGYEFRVQYPRNYDIRGVSTQLEDILTATRIPSVSPTMVKEAMKRAARAWLPGLSPERYGEIDDEIEAMELTGIEPGLPEQIGGEKAPSEFE